MPQTERMLCTCMPRVHVSFTALQCACSHVHCTCTVLDWIIKMFHWQRVSGLENLWILQEKTILKPWTAYSRVRVIYRKLPRIIHIPRYNEQHTHCSWMLTKHVLSKTNMLAYFSYLPQCCKLQNFVMTSFEYYVPAWSIKSQWLFKSVYKSHTLWKEVLIVMEIVIYKNAC